MDFLDMGPLELLMILVVVLLAVGPRKLPAIAKSIGRGVRRGRAVTYNLTKTLTEEFEKLEPSFDAVKKLKRDKTKRTDFPEWNRRLEKAFQQYKSQEAYLNIRDIIEESMEKNKHNIMFHEANACPEFWEQTRLAAGINLAEPLLKGAQSIIESDQGE